ncbi:MAG: hypothetical protein L0271_01240 [Gemmatimonadetes bacterium]|nr:hypothetical protein [Gemmatimonadota bacterium]
MSDGWTLRALRVALLGTVLGGTSPALAQRPGTQGLNPDISAIGDLFFDLSPERPRFTESGERFALAEVELGIQAFVDPFFRADFFLGLHEGQIEVEEGYVTALSLPGALQARLGRFALPFGKINLTHRPELLTVEYPHVIQQYFTEEGFRAAGVGLSRIFAPFGVFQELQFYVLSGLGEADAHGAAEGAAHGLEEEAIPEDVELIDAERSGIEQFAFMANLRTYHDLSTASNIEVGLSAASGHVERLRTGDCPDAGPCPAVLLAGFRSQRFWGANIIYRWRPPEQAIYRSFQWSAEVVGHDGPEATNIGLFTQAQVQLSRRTYLGARFDAVQAAGDQEIHVEGVGPDRVIEVEPHEGGEWFRAASGYFTFFPSEFSRFRLGLERSFGTGEREWRAVFQTTFSIGPHRPHAF